MPDQMGCVELMVAIREQSRDVPFLQPVRWGRRWQREPLGCFFAPSWFLGPSVATKEPGTLESGFYCIAQLGDPVLTMKTSKVSLSSLVQINT